MRFRKYEAMKTHPIIILALLAIGLFTIPLLPQHYSFAQTSIVQTASNHQSNSAQNALSTVFSSATTNGNLLIVSAQADSASSTTISSITDNASYTFTLRVSKCASSGGCSYIWTAPITRSTKENVTVHYSSSISYAEMTILELNGYTTTGLQTCTGSASGAQPNCSTSVTISSTSFIMNVFNSWGGSQSVCAPLYTSNDYNCNSWGGGSSWSDAPSNTGSQTVFWSYTGTGSTEQSVLVLNFPLVTLPISCSMVNAASAVTITISATGSPSPNSFSCNGSTHNISINGSLTYTLSNPAATSSTKYVLNSTSGTSCSSGTCTTVYLSDRELLNFTLKTSYSTTLTATQNGSSYTPTITASYVTYWIDYGTSWSVTNPVLISSTERYDSTNTTSGTVSTTKTEYFYYYHQFAFNLTYSLTGNPSAPKLTGTTAGSSVNPSLTKSYVSTWLDSASSWSVSTPMATINEKWNSSATLSGTVTAALKQNFSYSEYFNLTFSASPSIDGSTSPTGSHWYLSGSNQTIQALYSNPPFALKNWTSSNSTYFAIHNTMATLTYGIVNGASNVTAYYTIGNFYEVNVTWTRPDTNPMATQIPTITYFQNGVSKTVSLNSGGSYVTLWVDRGSTVTPQNPFYYDIYSRTPNPTSIVINSNATLDILYSQTPLPVSNDPFTNAINGQVLLAALGPYINLIGISNFMAIICLVICMAVFLKSYNPWVSITLMLVFGTTLTMYNAQTGVQSLLPSFYNAGMYALFALAISGLMVRIYTSR